MVMSPLTVCSVTGPCAPMLVPDTSPETVLSDETLPRPIATTSPLTVSALVSPATSFTLRSPETVRTSTAVPVGTITV
jgi:hypothetical protein